MKEVIIGNRICFIGRGEETLLKILKQVFPLGRFEQQVPLHRIVSLHDPSERQLKETIDILMILNERRYACRVNDNRHRTRRMRQIDDIQKRELENNNTTVLDFDEWECPTLFKEIFDHNSLLEVGFVLDGMMNKK